MLFIVIGAWHLHGWSVPEALQRGQTRLDLRGEADGLPSPWRVNEFFR